MSSFGFGPSKKGRIADASMMTRNVRIVAQGAADASYSDNPKKNPFRLSTAILNGYQYGGETIADTNNGVLPESPYVYTQQPLVDLFSPFTIGTWTLNGSASSSLSPLGIQISLNNLSGLGNRNYSAFNSNAVINVTYPFTITETFFTTSSAQSSLPTDGFVVALSPNKNFLGPTGGALGMAGAAAPQGRAVGISVNFGDNAGTAQITTNAASDPYSSSKTTIGTSSTASIFRDVKSNASTNITVSVTYDGSNTMAWSVSEGAYFVNSSQTGINLQTLLMSSNAYLGVTAGTGARYQPVYLTGTTYQTYA